MEQPATPIVEKVVGTELHVRSALGSLIGPRRPPLSGAHVPAQLHRAPGNSAPQKPFDSELAPPEEIETHTCLLKESRIAGPYGPTTRPVAKRPGSRGFAMSNLYGRTEEVFSRSYERGHFICHGAGGGCDWNLFPRVRSLNRGWTPHGARREKLPEKLFLLKRGRRIRFPCHCYSPAWRRISATMRSAIQYPLVRI